MLYTVDLGFTLGFRDSDWDSGKDSGDSVRDSPSLSAPSTNTDDRMPVNNGI